MKQPLNKLHLGKKTVMRLGNTGGHQLQTGAATACITAKECPPPPVTYTCFSFFCP